MKTKDFFKQDPKQTFEEEKEELEFLMKVAQGKELAKLQKRYETVMTILSGVGVK